MEAGSGGRHQVVADKEGVASLKCIPQRDQIFREKGHVVGSLSSVWCPVLRENLDPPRNSVKR